MLFLYLNKRADTVKDLINLYEKTGWDASVSSAVGNISISIDQLNSSICRNFEVLGQQLGVINSSILEYTEMQLLNAKKLDQIKDESSRQFLYLVQAIQKWTMSQMNILLAIFKTILL